jgi:hypothetical protein
MATYLAGSGSAGGVLSIVLGNGHSGEQSSDKGLGEHLECGLRITGGGIGVGIKEGREQKSDRQWVQKSGWRHEGFRI